MRMPPEPVAHPSPEWVESYAKWYENRGGEYRIITPDNLIDAVDEIIANAQANGLVDTCIGGCVKSSLKNSQ